MKFVFFVAENLRANHENIPPMSGKSTKKKNGQNFVSSYFRAFVVLFFSFGLFRSGYKRIENGVWEGS